VRATAPGQINEYVLDADATGEIEYDESAITYTDPTETGSSDDRSFTLHTEELTAIRIEENTTLTGTRLLGVFFALIALILTAGTGFVVNGYLSQPQAEFTLTSTSLAVGLLTAAGILGSWTTSFEYLLSDNPTVIDVYLETDTQTRVLCNETTNTDFTKFCAFLLTEDLPTTCRSNSLYAQITA
jgi:hypothetical protein